MSKQYVYTEGGYVHVLPEGTVIWNEAGDQNTSQYFDANNTIINDCTINESFNTAIGSDNETQYLSILESDAAELTLEDLSNLTIDGEDVSSILLLNNNSTSDVIEEKTTEETKNDNPDMVVFTMEGSDDLYGIQLMQDESGQMQKYQFKFRQTAEGQLEPIPESVTLLPNDDETEPLPVVEQEVVKNQDNVKEGSFLAMTETMQEESTDDIIKCHTASQQILVEKVVSSNQQSYEDANHTSVAATINYEIPSLAHIKKEHYLETIEECDEIDHSCDMDIGPVEIRNDQLDQINKNNLISNEIVEPSSDINKGQIFQHFMAPSYQVEVKYETEVEATECLSSLKNKLSEGKELNQSRHNTKISDFKSVTETLLHEHQDALSIKPRFEGQVILKEPKYKRQSISNPKYYVVYPEKENLMAVAQSNTIKTHQSVNKIIKTMKPTSRSVLRSSVAKNQEKQIVAQIKSAGSDCDIYLKRFSKNKDAMLAKRFHNFLNRTTIPQAPVRQKRQPRKQEIKPIVERSSEEIIVQEVLVSSNGFVESFDRDCDVKPLRVTAIVELSDSEDEKTSKSKSFKIRVNQKRKFDQSVIEIYSDEETVSNPNQTKSTSHLSIKNLDHPPPRAKRKKVQSKVKATSEFVLKKEVICPYCPKTFPSQNSLNTHIIHHNLENSLKNKTKMSLNTRQSMFAKPEYKHKCEECQATFRNKILLEKHSCTSKQKTLTCSVCLKQFRDMTLLNIHKKSHAKANLIKNTTLTKVSPRKSVLKVPSSPKNSLIGGFKCSECPKVCDSESKLSAHVKIHKKFVCTFCSGTFASKVMLDSHMRSNCVKNKRMSYTVKKSFVHTPTKRLSIASEADMSLNQSTLGMKMNCDKCSMKFGTFRSLYTHKVQKHGMSTPDKTLLNKPKGGVCDARSAHGGVPANPRLQQAFAVMRKKLAEAGNLTIK